MSLRKVDFSKVLNDDQVYDHMMASYDKLGRDWIVHQWSWMNNVYLAFKDHYKYLILISLSDKSFFALLICLKMLSSSGYFS